MPLGTGAPAPEFDLPAEPGGRLSLAHLTADGPALLAFFNTACPTCKASFEVWGRLAARFGSAVPVVAVAQDPLAEARAWLDWRGFDGPVVEDTAGGYATSRAYEIDTVPTLVLVDGDRNVVATSEGWDRQRANAWADQLGQLTGLDGGPVSEPGDGLPDFKPG